MLYNNRKEIPIFIYTDNRSLLDTVNSTTNVTEKTTELILLLLQIHSNVSHAMFTGFQQKNN